MNISWKFTMKNHHVMFLLVAIPSFRHTEHQPDGCQPPGPRRIKNAWEIPGFSIKISIELIPWLMTPEGITMYNCITSRLKSPQNQSETWKLWEQNIVSNYLASMLPTWFHTNLGAFLRRLPKTFGNPQKDVEKWNPAQIVGNSEFNLVSIGFRRWRFNWKSSNSRKFPAMFTQGPWLSPEGSRWSGDGGIINSYWLNQHNKNVVSGDVKMFSNKKHRFFTWFNSLQQPRSLRDHHWLGLAG